VNKSNFGNASFIIDGSSFLYRAYYSISSLTTKDGIPVNAVYGFCRMIKKLVDSWLPNYIIVVWDGPGKTVRHQMYGDYKATRQAAPSDLFSQKELIKEFADSIGLCQIQFDGIEADDIMYSLAQDLSKELQVILVTSDKDMRQAISDKIVILDPFKDVLIDQKYIEEKNGFPLDRLVLYYALIGDSSDNIPGVKGIGPKTAQELARNFSSLEEVYEKLDLVKSDRVKGLLANDKENAFLSRDLFKLKFYETGLTKESCAYSIDNWADAQPFFERFGFKSLIKYPENTKEAKQQTLAKVDLHKKYQFKTVTDIEELKEICAEIKKHKKFAIDTETTGCDALTGKIVGLSLCYTEGTSYYVPFAHIGTETQLSKQEVFSVLQEILSDESIEKALHNAKFDILVLEAAGVAVKGPLFDTIVAASLIFPEGQRLGLKALSEQILNDPMFSFGDLVNKNRYANFAYVPFEEATQYAAADAHQTFLLYKMFEKKLKEKNLRELFDQVEIPLISILCKMEKIGIKVDIPMLHEINVKVTAELAALYTEILELIRKFTAEDAIEDNLFVVNNTADYSLNVSEQKQQMLLGFSSDQNMNLVTETKRFSALNLNSPKQVSEMLFDHLKLTPVKKTTGKTARSTDYEVLKKLAKVHPVPALIIKYRELFKLKTTYLEALVNAVKPRTGKIHTSFNQIAVATGRLSSYEPNLQNIPVHKFNVRAAFKASPGSVFISADYSQIELRVLAHFSKDAVLIEAFINHKDIHAITSAKLFNVSVEEVTSEQRQIGKRINFSILYGLTAHGLSNDLEISHSLAKEYIDKFMAQYPQVSEWMEQVVEDTKAKGYVETYLGRRRYLPGIHERNRIMFDLARRVAINTVAQGTAAEIVKLGMIELDKVIGQIDNAHVLLQIHDELVIECPADQAEQLSELVKSKLENVVSWNIPLVVTTRIGPDWQSITK